MSDTFSDEHPTSRDVDADHLVETPESLRDDDPEAPPMDRGSEASDRPLGAEKFGTTHAEAEQGESLDQRLAEEVPETGTHDPVEDVVADDPAAFGESTEQTDEQVLDDAYGDPAASDLVPGRDGGDLPAEEAALHLEEER